MNLMDLISKITIIKLSGVSLSILFRQYESQSFDVALYCGYLCNGQQFCRTLSLGGNCILSLPVCELKCLLNHPPLPELKEEMGLCSRSVFGMEPSQMSFLFFLMYAAAAGGLLPLLECTPGSAQEFKIKVHSSYPPPECILLTLVPYNNLDITFLPLL